MDEYYQSESIWDAAPEFGGRLSHPRFSGSHFDLPFGPQEHVDEEIVTTYRRSTSPTIDPWHSRSFTPPPRALRDEWLTSPAGASSFAGSSVGPISPMGNSFFRTSPTRRPASYYSPVAPPPALAYDTFDEEEEYIRSRSPTRRYRRRRSPSLSRSRSPMRPRSRSRSFTPVRSYMGAPESPMYRPMPRSPRAYYDSAPQEEVIEEHFSSVTTTHADGTSTTEYNNPPPRVYSSPRSGRISPTFVDRPSYSSYPSYGRRSPVGEHIEEEVFEETTTTTTFL